MPAGGRFGLLEARVGKSFPRALLQSHRRSAIEGWSEGARRAVSDFKGRHFEGVIVLWAVRRG